MPNKLRINNGGLRILASGRLRANGCFVADAQKLFVHQQGELSCSG